MSVTSRVGPVALLLVVLAACGSERQSDLEVEATVRFVDIEGGCWVLRTDSVSYSPTELAEEFRQDGLAVRAGLDLRDDLGGFCMLGPIVDVAWIERR